MSAESWNHNTHYHGLVLRSLGAGRRRALDVGCGEGALARLLARHCDEVDAIDIDSVTLARAVAATGDARIAFHEGDVMSYPFADESFDAVTAVAALHHLPLRPALARLRALLRPGGVLVIVGLYRLSAPEDYATAMLGHPASRLLRLLNGHAETAAPIRAPEETLGEIRAAARAILPGAEIRRRLLFRYSLIWRKPPGPGGVHG